MTPTTDVRIPSETLVRRALERAWLDWQDAAITGSPDEAALADEVARWSTRLQELRAGA